MRQEEYYCCARFYSQKSQNSIATHVNTFKTKMELIVEIATVVMNQTRLRMQANCAPFTPTLVAMLEPMHIT